MESATPKKSNPKTRTLARWGLACLLVLFSGRLAFSAITVTSPSSQKNVKACADYSDEVLLDKWDMNERTDLGWRTFNTVEQPLSYLTSISFQNGVFSARSVYTPGGSADYSDANITLLDSHYPGSAPLGKIGTNFPIDAAKYTILALRMSIEPDCAGYYGQLLWSKNTIYGGITTSGAFYIHNGWSVYLINIPALGIGAGSDPWTGLIDSLRMDPLIKRDKLIQIDWIRLVQNDLTTQEQITWSGNTGNVDVYLDNDNDAGNGNLGCLARNVGGTSYAFLAGALASGNYYVAVAPTGTTTYSYSSGFYHVNDVPVLNFSAPSDEGSDRDFITVRCADPWDMANSQDVEHTVNVQSPQFTTISYEDHAGNTHGNKTVYLAQSVSGSGDPTVFFLHFLYRGSTYRIDTDKYHNLVFKTGIWGAQSVNDGSIARVIWRNKNETVENVSQDIIIRHLPDRWVMSKVVCDMKTLPIEEGAGSPSHSGWTGEADCFRIDPHEFTESRAFFFDDIKLTADITADISYTIEWTLADSDDTPTISLYYDTNNSGYDGTLVAGGIPAPAGQGSCAWDTSSVAGGKYWIYAVANDGVNQNRCYSRGPVVISHTGSSEINLSKKTLNFGAIQVSSATGKEKVTITNSGEGTLNWQATTAQSWIDVSPASGTGNGSIEIGIATTSLYPATYQGTVTVTDSNASNSPQIITVNLTVYAPGGDSGPFGVFDTPTSGLTVSGSVAVTGWALDDVEVKKVWIKREPDPDDPAGAIGSDGLVYIGDAVFVKGSRPDVEAYYPNYPRADRAGWGYMMLTFGLPRRGNGTFRIYAFAEDSNGRTALLGIKQITADNAHRTQPFGTIDTPNQGETISGSAYVNFGWALTPAPNMIPTDGSTIWVSMDSVFIGHPVYNNYRVDVASSFPECLNANGAVGYFFLDTTQYANGVHNIGWLAYDNAGNGDGMGSRFIEIQNLGAGAQQSEMEPLEYNEDPSGRLRIRVLGEREIEIEELGRVEVILRGPKGAKFIGWGKDKSRDLPIGSTLDKEAGIFTWSPAPGFLGKQVLHFAAAKGRLMSKPVEVIINIVPGRYEKDLLNEKSKKQDTLL